MAIQTWTKTFQHSSNKKLYFDVNISLESQSIEDNTSTISYTITERLTSGSLTSDSTGHLTYFLIKNLTGTGTGNEYNGQFTKIDLTMNAAGSQEIASDYDITIKHNSDGSRIMNCVYVQSIPNVTQAQEWSFSITLPDIPRAAKVLTATNFTDEENPVITYSNPGGEKVTKLEACISFTGGNDDIAYREISKTDSSYTFELTEDEKNVLRIGAINAQSVSVRFYLKTTTGGTTYFDYVTRTLTITNCNPIINNPTVVDIHPDILALTGDENTLVRHASMVEYSFEPIATKYATIVSQYIQNGSKKITGLNQGVIDDVESGLFIFSATDSRGATSTATIEKPIVEYIKPTCYQNLAIELDGETETSAIVTLKVNGSYFNGTFGAVSNTLKIEVRHTQNDGSMGDWVNLTDGLIPVFNGNTYELTTTISGFIYSQAYTFQCRVTDALYTVPSAEYTIRSLPVFDWGEADFNFNVPVNINGEVNVNAENFKMHDEIILRHSTSTNNTVLSGTGGHIYLRPGGTTDTTSEAIIYPDGSVNFSGEVTVNGEPISGGGIDLSVFGDYIVEVGTEDMGSNGTWYWEKWNSGKAVCWGCRNFGSMAVSTAFGTLYRSGNNTQTFPANLFIASPDSVIVHSDARSAGGAGYGGWVMKNHVNKTQVYFYILMSSSGNFSATDVNFHVTGRWKE